MGDGSYRLYQSERRAEGLGSEPDVNVCAMTPRPDGDQMRMRLMSSFCQT